LVDADFWGVNLDLDRTRVMYRGQEVTDAIASENVGIVASQISKFPKVRAKLLKNQRDCQGTSLGLIAEGRDCGSVVFPDACLKIYLTADQESRANRRAQEGGDNLDHVKKLQEQRDRNDEKRKTAPLQVPEGAIVIDTTFLHLSEVVDKVFELQKSAEKLG
jgi:CMP/dCMP kinase